MDTPYISRTISEAIAEASSYFPVITVTGPRQSGKSTLLRHMFPEADYKSVEDLDIRRMALDDPRGFLSSGNRPLIIDEVQHVPELLSYIQSTVDANPNRKFYLTGSSQFALLKTVSQSLAGRSAVFELMPLALNELRQSIADKSTDELLYSGFYPAIWSGKNIPRLLYPNYVKTYIERDVRNILSITNLDAYQRFIKLCAARIGSIFNASELANEIGIAVNTVNSWLSVLQTSYIIYLLPPFHTNTRKRLTKSPKLYFTDCGLAAYLLEIDSAATMNRDKMRGHLFENMIISEYLKRSYNAGKNGGLYFYRDSNGNEVDLLIKSGSRYHCIEIKAAETFHTDAVKGIESFRKAFPDLIADSKVIYTGPDMAPYLDSSVVNFKNL